MPTSDATKELDPCTPPHLWGITLTEGQPEGASHVIIQRVGVPEGGLDIARCTGCGAIVEVLHDLRNVSAWDGTGVRTEASPDGSTESSIFDLWLPYHRDCGSDPSRDPAFDSRLVEVRDKEVARASRNLSSGEDIPVSAALVIARSDDETDVVRVPYHQLDFESRDEKRVQLELIKALTREWLRDGDEEVLGAVATFEGWFLSSDGEEAEMRPPSEHPDRKEGLGVEIRSRSGTELRLAPIERTSGVPDEGPGTVEESKIIGTAGWSRLLDGLLAADSVSSR